MSVDYICGITHVLHNDVYAVRFTLYCKSVPVIEKTKNYTFAGTLPCRQDSVYLRKSLPVYPGIPECGKINLDKDKAVRLWVAVCFKLKL